MCVRGGGRGCAREYKSIPTHMAYTHMRAYTYKYTGNYSTITNGYMIRILRNAVLT
jgi:hypothetical protein